MSEVRYFLGGNTPAGFYSLYHQLSDPQRVPALYILKGGAGCGKSSLMKRVARHARAAGEEVITFPCSGDPDSLDGVLLPRLGAALVDGTSPHVVEGKYPGVVERYVDLSQFYHRKALLPLKEELLAATQAYQGHYKRVYRCLGAAGELRRDLNELALTPQVEEKLKRRAKGIIGRELKGGAGESGRLEQRFLGAVTCKGRVTLWDTVTAQAQRVYALQDSNGLAHTLLAPILAAALAGGWDVVACPDPMAPDRLAHLIIPQKELAFVTSSPEQPWKESAYRHLRLDAVADQAGGRGSRGRARFTRRVVDALEEEAMAGLGQAKAAHDQLEALYNPHVQFEGVYQLADQLAQEILEG